MIFWAIAIGLAALAALLLVLALLRGGAEEAGPGDVEIYRDQLAEVERDRARGTLTDAEAERLRTEVSRRLLEADRAAAGRSRAGSAPRGATLAAAALACLVVVGGALALYDRIGAPGYPDMPLEARKAEAARIHAERPSQQAAEARVAEAQAGGLPNLPGAADPDPAFADLMDKLRKTLESRPDDLRGHELLARNEAGLGNFAAAARAQQVVIRLKGEAADAEDRADLAEYLILAAGGYVSPEAEQQLAAALKLDPGQGRARYYTGLMYAQTGRPDIAFRLWRQLLEKGPEDAPWIAPIRAQIAPLARLAGVEYDPPAPKRPAPALKGPNQADMAAAADMTPEERQDMIRTMVQGLSDRLASQGGTPEEWARLINALGVLGEGDRAAAIWDEARQSFADRPEALATIRAAAERAGVAAGE